MNRRIETVFISAPFNAKTENIRAALSANGVRILSVQDSLSGATIASRILGMIRQADLVIGVLTNDVGSVSLTSRNVMLEIGFALGLQKKVIIFAHPKSDIVPIELSDQLVIRTSLQNREAIGFALKQVLAAPERVSNPMRPPENVGLSLGEKADLLVAEYEEISGGREPKQLENLVGRALTASAVEIISESPHRDRGADFAVWADAFQASVGNPLLIEIKQRLKTRSEVKRAIDQLTEATKAAGSVWGLLLYGEGLPRSDRVWLSKATVLSISIPELFERMRTRPFVEVILELRNHRTHGFS